MSESHTDTYYSLRCAHYQYLEALARDEEIESTQQAYEGLQPDDTTCDWTLHEWIQHGVPGKIAGIIAQASEEQLSSHDEHFHRTPLHIAAVFGNQRAIATLLDQGASLTDDIQRDRRLSNPEEPPEDDAPSFCEGFDPSVLFQDKEPLDDWTPLHDAAIIACDVDTVRLLLVALLQQDNETATKGHIQLCHLESVIQEVERIQHHDDEEAVHPDETLAPLLQKMRPEFDCFDLRQSETAQEDRRKIRALLKLVRYQLKITLEIHDLESRPENSLDCVTFFFQSKDRQLAIKQEKLAIANQLSTHYIQHPESEWPQDLNPNDENLNSRRLGKCFRRLLKTSRSDVDDRGSDESLFMGQS